MKTPEISIVVPVYNVEQYLVQCLDSILNQTFTDWECIAVDDGSTDNSGKIIEEYAERDSRFVVVHQKNGGLSAARNAALKAAKGKYIGFVDSDDWLSPEMYEELHKIITENDSDMAQVGFIKEYVGFSHPKKLVKKLRVLSHNDLVYELCKDKILPSYMWIKLFKREVITDPFPEGKVFEDIFTMNKWMRNIKKGVLSPKPLYHYRYRKGSISHVSSVDYRLNFFEACKQRFYGFDKSDPDVIKPSERNKLLWKRALSCAKIIARMDNVPVGVKTEGISKVLNECQDLPEPNKKILGARIYYDIRLLSHPKLFIYKKLMSKWLDFHTKYRIKHAYD